MKEDGQAGDQMSCLSACLSFYHCLLLFFCLECLQHILFLCNMKKRLTLFYQLLFEEVILLIIRDYIRSVLSLSVCQCVQRLQFGIRT